MLNNIFHHEIALPASCVEERGKEAKTTKISFYESILWDTNAFNEIIDAILITKCLVFVHAVMGSQLA